MNPTEQRFAFSQQKLEESLFELDKTISKLSKTYTIMVVFAYLSKVSIIILGLLLATKFFQEWVSAIGFTIAVLTACEPIFLNSKLIGEIGEGAKKLDQTMSEARAEHNQILQTYFAAKENNLGNGASEFAISLGELEVKISKVILDVKSKVERAKVMHVKSIFKGSKQ